MALSGKEESEKRKNGDLGEEKIAEMRTSAILFGLNYF